MFEWAEEPPSERRDLRWRSAVPFLLFVCLLPFQSSFLRTRYLSLAYVLGTAIALFPPVAACRVRFATRAVILAVLFTPNLVIGHGVFILAAWRTLFYPMVPGIIPLSIAAIVVYAGSMARHTAATPGHPDAAACRRRPHVGRVVFVSAIILAAVFLPIHGAFDRARFAVAYHELAATAIRDSDVPFSEAAFVVYRLEADLGLDQAIRHIYRTTRGNIEVLVGSPAGDQQTYIFIGGARGALVDARIVTPEGP